MVLVAIVFSRTNYNTRRLCMDWTTCKLNVYYYKSEREREE